MAPSDELSTAGSELPTSSHTRIKSESPCCNVLASPKEAKETRESMSDETRQGILRDVRLNQVDSLSDNLMGEAEIGQESLGRPASASSTNRFVSGDESNISSPESSESTITELVRRSLC